MKDATLFMGVKAKEIIKVEVYKKDLDEPSKEFMRVTVGDKVKEKELIPREDIYDYNDGKDAVVGALILSFFEQVYDELLDVEDFHYSVTYHYDSDTVLGYIGFKVVESSEECVVSEVTADAREAASEHMNGFLELRCLGDTPIKEFLTLGA